MSLSVSSYESDVAYDEGNNIFDMTIDATSTACLDIVNLMMNGSNCGTKKSSNIMKSWIKAFDCLVVDSFELERVQSKKRLSDLKRSYTHNPAREHKGRVSKSAFQPRFHPDFSESYDDTLADQSVELDQSTLSAFVEADSVDQSDDIDYSAYDSEEASFDEGSSGFQSYESDDEDYLSESLDEADSLPRLKKIRRRTVISITRAGHCVDQIDMGAFVDPRSTEKRHGLCVQQKTLEVKPRTSPTSSILASDDELSRNASAKAILSGRTQGDSLVCLSRNLFSEEATPSSSTLESVRRHVMTRRNLLLTSVDLRWWFANQDITSDFPVQLVSHRLNVLSQYNPFSSLFQKLIVGILKGLEIAKKNESKELPPVTVIYSNHAAYEVSIDGERGDLSAIPKRVSWSPHLSFHYHA